LFKAPLIGKIVPGKDVIEPKLPLGMVAGRSCRRAAVSRLRKNRQRKDKEKQKPGSAQRYP
jgi:hypothetical protein